MPFETGHSSAAPAGNPKNIRMMLSNLPSSDAFSEFDGTLPADSFHRYLETEYQNPEVIRTEKKRCLIRALTAKGDGGEPRREAKRKATDMPGVVSKRPRWTSLDKERKQACIRVALVAACRHGRAGDRVHRLRDGWLENPRRKQMVNAEVRRALADTVAKWSEAELKSYLERAGIGGVITVEGMIRAVRDHLAPETEVGQASPERGVVKHGQVATASGST